MTKIITGEAQHRVPILQKCEILKASNFLKKFQQ